MRKLLFALAILVPMLALADDDEGSIIATNEGNNSELGVVLNQDIDLTENSLVTVAPALSADGVDCNMESRSYSILVWSFGKSKCEKGSVIWRDYVRIMQIAGPAAAMAVVCSYKPFRKVAHLAVMADGTVGVDCRKLRKLPPHVHTNADR